MYVVSKNNTIHIPLFNYTNSICYYIVVIQKLHASPTLSKLMNNSGLTMNNTNGETLANNSGETLANNSGLTTMNNNGETLMNNNGEELSFITIDNHQPLSTIDNHQPLSTNNNHQLSYLLLSPLKVYSKITESNTVEIYNEMRKVICEFFDKYVSSEMVNGFMPMNLLLYYFLPAIHQLFPSEFRTIVNELYINPLDFPEYMYESTPLFKNNEHQRMMSEMYQVMKNNNRHPSMNNNNEQPSMNNNDEHSSMVVDFMEIYTIDNSVSGHVVSLIKDINNKFQIIDDQFHVVEFNNYYKLYYHKIVKLKIINIDAESIAMINAGLSNGIFRSSLRSYTLDNSDKFKRVSLGEKFNDFTYSTLKGGNKVANYYLIIFYIVFSLLLIIVVIISYFYQSPTTTMINVHK